MTTSAKPSAPSMSLPELQSWSDERLRQLLHFFGTPDADPEEYVFHFAAKLSEEIGELNADLLGRVKMQRTSKGQDFTQESLAAEFADVLICVGILASALNVDLGQALAAKIGVVEQRPEVAEANAQYGN